MVRPDEMMGEDMTGERIDVVAMRTMMDTKITRRRFAAVAGGAMAAVGAGFTGRVAAQDTATRRTTAAVNLRSGAGTTFAVLTVIPAGQVVGYLGNETAGFARVTWSGREGWVSTQYLAQGGGSGTPPTPPAAGYDGQAKVLEAVNMRAEASTTSAVLLVVPAQGVVATSSTTSNGFRAVQYGGKTGWMIAGALVPVTAPSTPSSPSPTPSTPPTTAGSGYINTPSNFRMEPTYGNNVIRVLPVNTVVTITTERSGDFVRVQTPGDIGWVFAAYVTAGAPPTSNPGTPPPTGSTSKTTAAVNFRADASTGAQVLAVIPFGTPVVVIGSAKNGFTPVYWNGTNGWVSSAYLSAGGGAPATPTYRTTAVLNLRAQANANSALVAVIPVGATVSATGQGQAGYLGVSWNGQSGFVLAAYLVPA